MKRTLDEADLLELFEVARLAALEAAALVLEGFCSPLIVEHKGRRTDLVTRFDRESERLLLARLERTKIAVAGEELSGEAPRGEPVFFVDPIDGTTNFVHGHPFFAVSIGLVAPDHEGRERPLLGVVTAPALGWTFGGVVSQEDGAPPVVAASRSGAPCHTSATSQLEDALLATGFPYDRATNADNNFEAFVAVKKRCRGIRRCGSASLDLCLVANGTYDGYWERRLGPWDLAGGTAILRAAGGRVTSFSGPLDVREGHVVATNGLIHEELLRVVEPYPRRT